MTFVGFDPFMLVFTGIIIWAFVKYAKSGDLFLKGFIGSALLSFLIMDVVMIASWFGVDLNLNFIRNIF
jgi:hypothetical protein